MTKIYKCCQLLTFNCNFFWGTIGIICSIAFMKSMGETIFVYCDFCLPCILWGSGDTALLGQRKRLRFSADSVGFSVDTDMSVSYSESPRSASPSGWILHVVRVVCLPILIFWDHSVLHTAWYFWWKRFQASLWDPVVNFAKPKGARLGSLCFVHYGHHPAQEFNNFSIAYFYLWIPICECLWMAFACGQSGVFVNAIISYTTWFCWSSKRDNVSCFLWPLLRLSHI